MFAYIKINEYCLFKKIFLEFGEQKTFLQNMFYILISKQIL